MHDDFKSILIDYHVKILLRKSEKVTIFMLCEEEKWYISRLSQKKNENIHLSKKNENSTLKMLFEFIIYKIYIYIYIYIYH